MSCNDSCKINQDADSNHSSELCDQSSSLLYTSVGFALLFLNT